MSDTLNELYTKETFTGTASEAITEGALVAAIAGSEVTQTGSVEDKIGIKLCNESGDALICVGVAFKAAASGALVTVATQGLFRFRASAAITAGAKVQFAASTDPYEVKTLVDATINAAGIGRALTGCSAANEYVVVALNVG